MMVISAYQPYRQMLLTLLVGLMLTASCATRAGIEPFVTGLNQPRGLAFDAAGNLFVAEVGALRPSDTGGPKPEINHSGRILRINTHRQVTVTVDGLPYTHYVANGDTGAADVVSIDGALYVLTGEGYDDQVSRSVLRVVPGAPPHLVANILNFMTSITPLEYQMSHGGVPVNPYALALAPDGSALYVSDGASGRVLRVTFDGTMRRFAELPDMPPLVGLAFGPDERLYIAMFSALSHTVGSGAIWVADSSGSLTVAASRLTMPIDVGFDAAGRLYVLEFSDGMQLDQPYAPGSGRLLRIGQNDSRTVVLDHLNYPTAMVFSRAGDLYIAVGGAFTAPGQGAIVKLPCRELHAPATCPQ